MLTDVFNTVPQTPNVPHHIAKENQNFEETLTKLTREKGFIPHPPWVTKIMQLHQLSKVHHGKCCQQIKEEAASCTCDRSSIVSGVIM